uniref:B30.2/SPRY domain-containing protein n=1 Tax=Latimeria chalumnae TaxID=7897 RepID=H2ZSA9_LATCH
QKELNPAVKHLQGTQEKLSKVKEKYCKHLNHIQDQAQKTEKQINEDFVKLHQFLHEEEKNLLADLRKEKEEKEQKMKEKIKSISEEMTSLSINIKDIEKKMDQGDSFFLMHFTVELNRVGTEEPDLQATSDALTHKHRAPAVTFPSWEQGLQFTSNTPLMVTLDPNTAHPELTLLEDLTTVTLGSTRKEDLPDNPERFDVRPCVLGSEGFTSGRHSWVVDVEKLTRWVLGVAAESANRKGGIKLKPELGYLTVGPILRGYTAFTDKGPTRLDVLKTPKKVLVCVDYEAGKVSFSHADDMSHIYTFTHKFKHKIFPFFCLLTRGAPVRICNL